MMFHNDYDIERNVRRFQDHPVLGPATRFLADFKELIDSNSDGWAYWRPPVVASKKLMILIDNPETATEATFKKALTPIKSFCTRRELPCPPLR